jgi:hypothetical protein
MSGIQLSFLMRMTVDIKQSCKPKALAITDQLEWSPAAFLYKAPGWGSSH